MSIIRKNLRATKGKKRWRRNIDVDNLLEDIEQTKRQESIQKKVQESMKQKPLFFLDSKPDQKVKERQALAEDRFKKKPKAPLSKVEEKRLSKIAKKLQDKQEQKDNMNKLDYDPNDPWNNDALRGRKKIITRSDDIKYPAVVPPVEGQSYNPTLKAHKDLLNNVVEEEEKKDDRDALVEFFTENLPKFNEKRRRPRSLAEKIELEDRAQRKLLKKQEQDIMYIKSIVKKMTKEEEEHNKKLEELKKKEEEEKKLIEAGKLFKNHRVGRGKYYHRGSDFQLVGDLRPTLRQLNTTGNLIRDQYDGIFRRNLVEPPSSLKKKKSKIPKWKYHSTDRDPKKDDDNLGVFN